MALSKYLPRFTGRVFHQNVRQGFNFKARQLALLFTVACYAHLFLIRWQVLGKTGRKKCIGLCSQATLCITQPIAASLGRLLCDALPVARPTMAAADWTATARLPPRWYLPRPHWRYHGPRSRTSATQLRPTLRLQRWPDQGLCQPLGSGQPVFPMPAQPLLGLVVTRSRDWISSWAFACHVRPRV